METDEVLNEGIFPQPHRRQSVSVGSEHGPLFGTVDLPEADAPCPAVLIISGSGPTDRDGNSETIKKPNDSLKMVGGWLTSSGIAAVRYDKRGVGESADARGSVDDTTFKDMIDDAVRWIEMLRNDGRFSSVGVLGHSEGSLVAICAAARIPVDFLVSIAGAGRPINVILREQLERQPKFITKKAFPILKELEEGRRVEKVPFYLKSLFAPSLQGYVISWIAYDPAEAIAKLDMPMLIVQGTTDLQTAQRDGEILAAANPRAELRLIDGMNHILKDAPENQLKNFRTYKRPDLPLTDEFVRELEAFLDGVVSK